MYLSEVQRRQCYIDKMIGSAKNLQQLVVNCLNDDPKGRPVIAEISTTTKEFAQRTEESMGKPFSWWISVSDEHQLEQKKTILPEDQTAVKKKIDDLESELKIMRQFMEKKNIMKDYKKYTEEHKPVEHKQEPWSLKHRVGRSLLRHFPSFNYKIHKYYRQHVQKSSKRLPSMGRHSCNYIFQKYHYQYVRQSSEKVPSTSRRSSLDNKLYKAAKEKPRSSSYPFVHKLI